MKFIWLSALWLLLFGVICNGLSANVSSRPSVVTLGAIFSFDSPIGKVAKIAIEEAVKDVNANSTVLKGTKLVVNMHDSNCSGFVGMLGAMQFMETDAVAIIGPQSSVVAHTLSFVTNELQVPLLSYAATDPTLSSLQFPYFVRTTQSDLYQMKAIADIVYHYGWKKIVVLYLDDDYGRNGMSALDDALVARHCKISYKVGIPPKASNRDDIMDILVKVKDVESRIIVLHTYPTIGFMVFSVAKYLGMTGNGCVWIATDWLTSVADSSADSPLEEMDDLQGALVLRQHTADSERKRAFSKKFVKMTGGTLGLNSYGFYAYDTVWLVAHAVDAFFSKGGIVSFSNYSKLQAVEGSNLHLEAMSIFDGGPLLLKNILQSDFIGLTGAVKFDSDRSVINPAYDIMNVVGTGFHRIGYWSNYSGLSTVLPEELYTMPPNLSNANQVLKPVVWPGDTVDIPRGWSFPENGNFLRIGVPNRASFREFVSHVKGTDDFKGFCIDVFTAAEDLLGYSFHYRFIPFGDGHKNPSYNEIVQKITTGELDGVVGDIAIVTNRTKEVDFTQPFAASGLVVVAPFKQINTGAWAFLRPFSPQMWGVTAIFFIVVGMVVWILEHRINDEFRGPPKRQLITVVWFSLSTMFFAHRENTMSTLGRVQQLYSPIKGIESLKESHEPIGYQEGSFSEHYLTGEIGIAKSRLIPLGSPEEYATALLKGPKNGGVAAVVDERPYVELFLSSQCKFRIVGQEFTRSGWGFAFPRDSPFAIDFSTAILKLSEDGDLQRIHDKWLTTSTCSQDNTEIDSDQLHLKSFWGLFLICGVVCFVALVIYFLRVVQKYRGASSGEPDSEGQSGSHSKRIHTLLSIIDEKTDPSGRHKRRKLESLSNGNLENDMETDARTPKKLQTPVS
ncbi:hypothetical protein Leryth_000695 [Lithospermum erythrorhizon]|nr:hypothetical protein Leryth_000695 [Lithospermum erythrorhizon]